MSLFTRMLKSFLGEPTPRPARLAAERLETREVPAVVASYNPTDKVLTVTGTPQADQIVVRQDANGLHVLGKFVYSGGGTTTVEVIDGIVIESGSVGMKRETILDVPANKEVRKIVVRGGGGNDAIDLNSPSSGTSRPIRIPTFVYGEGGDDTVWGAAGDDHLDGGSGKDRLIGLDGNDTLVADVGLDLVNGGKGNDTIRATLSLDNMEQGKNGWLFWNDSFAAGNGTDRIVTSLDLGSFGRKLFQPIVGEVRRAAAVFDPVIDLLNRQVPVLSRYDSSLTFGRLLDQYSSGVGTFRSAVATLKGLSSAASFSGTVSLGEVKVTSGSAPTLSTAAWANPFTAINNRALTAARNAGVKFALLENAQAAVRMMMGKNVELVTTSLALPSVSAELSKRYEIPLGIFGLNGMIEFGGRVSASARATFGLDMAGVWKGRLQDGFFVRDAVASLTATAEVKGGVSVGIPNVVSIGDIYGYGNLSGTLKLALKGGGKVYADDLQSYSGGLRASGQIAYDMGFGVDYKTLKTKYRTVWGVSVPSVTWESETHRKSLGSGTFRL